MKSGIILIGMPSSGKSTVGVLLAKHLGLRFVDSDLVIQETSGKLLHELIEELGTDGFLKLENEINQTIPLQNAVISTGGSAVYGQEAMRRFREHGRVVYLKIDFKTLKSRLGDYSHRGVVLKKGQSLRDLYEERSRLYETYADAVVDESLCMGLSDTVERVTALCMDDRETEKTTL